MACVFFWLKKFSQSFFIYIYMSHQSAKFFRFPSLNCAGCSVKNCWQITFVTLNTFCPSSKPSLSPTPPVLKGQYQDGQNTNQNQKKNTCRFYIVFQVLKVLLIKICKIQSLDLLFIVVFNLLLSFYLLLAFTIADIIFHKFLKLHSELSEKNIFVTIFLF